MRQPQSSRRVSLKVLTLSPPWQQTRPRRRLSHGSGVTGMETEAATVTAGMAVAMAVSPQAGGNGSLATGYSSLPAAT